MKYIHKKKKFIVTVIGQEGTYYKVKHENGVIYFSAIFCFERDFEKLN